MRQIFDLYICLRPCKAYYGNPLNYKEGIDIVIFRENIEDLYSGVEFYPVPKIISDVIYKNSKQFENFINLSPEEFAISLKINTKKGSYRLIKSAFEYAKKKGRRKITIVHKANVIRATDGLFLEIAKEISKDYNEIIFEDVNIDALTMWLLKNPNNYDVLVAPNLYGDIISDLCAQMVGGLGFAYSGNIGENFAIFEPTHGSAPKYTGQYKVNPIASILAAKMMLEWLGEDEKSKIIENAVEEVIKEGKVKTYDMGGKNSTIEMAEAIASKL
jgi:isocitrate/isopropylmalate dehydrogenase